MSQFTFHCEDGAQKQHWIARIKQVMIDFFSVGTKKAVDAEPAPPPPAERGAAAAGGVAALQLEAEITPGGEGGQPSPRTPMPEAEPAEAAPGSPSMLRRKFGKGQSRKGSVRMSRNAKQFSFERPPVDTSAPDNAQLMHNPYLEAGGFAEVHSVKKIQGHPRRPRQFDPEPVRPTTHVDGGTVVRCNFAGENARTSVLVRPGDSLRSALAPRLARQSLNPEHFAVSIAGGGSLDWDADCLEQLGELAEIDVVPIPGAGLVSPPGGLDDPAAAAVEPLMIDAHAAHASPAAKAHVLATGTLYSPARGPQPRVGLRPHNAEHWGWSTDVTAWQQRRSPSPVKRKGEVHEEAQPVRRRRRRRAAPHTDV